MCQDDPCDNVPVFETDDGEQVPVFHNGAVVTSVCQVSMDAETCRLPIGV